MPAGFRVPKFTVADQALLGFEHRNIRRRIEAEFSKAPGCKLARRNLARRLPHLQQPKCGIEMRRKLGRHEVLHAIDRPPSRLAMQRNAVGTRANLDAIDLGRGDGEQALGRKRHFAAQLRPSPGGDENDEKRYQKSGRERCSPSNDDAPDRRPVQRRLHHISTPQNIVLRGIRTTSTMKVSRICRLVSTICGRS